MKYDCLIGVSGGKDSTYQVYVAKEVLGLKPRNVYRADLADGNWSEKP